MKQRESMYQCIGWLVFAMGATFIGVVIVNTIIALQRIR